MVRVFTYNGIRGIIALACAIIFATLFNGQGQAVGDYIGAPPLQGRFRRARAALIPLPPPRPAASLR
jgi:hypothetical protein